MYTSLRRISCLFSLICFLSLQIFSLPSVYADPQEVDVGVTKSFRYLAGGTGQINDTIEYKIKAYNYVMRNTSIYMKDTFPATVQPLAVTSCSAIGNIPCPSILPTVTDLQN
jgi:hypothetical protein